MTIVIVPDPAPDVISHACAPDRLPWPSPPILVDTSEQTPIAFGHVPAMWEEGAPVHYGQRDAHPHSIFRRLVSPYPWRCIRANLAEGDYQLEDPRTPGAPIPMWCAIETKRNDLVSSMTAGRVRLEAEFARLAGYKYPALVACVSNERLLGLNDLKQPRNAEGKELSLIGTYIALSFDYRVPWEAMPDRAVAEYEVAWRLLRAWRVWLCEVPEGLAEVRRIEANDRAHERPVIQQVAAELVGRRDRKRAPRVA